MRSAGLIVVFVLCLAAVPAEAQRTGAMNELATRRLQFRRHQYTCIRNVPPNGDQLLPCPDVYLHDRTAGLTTRLSVPAAGGQGNEASTDSAISADGAWITFVSSASNLVPGDTNTPADIFLVERSTGVISLVSRTPAGTSTGGASVGPSITGDGRYTYSNANGVVWAAGESLLATPLP